MTQRVNALISNKENNEPPGGRSAEIINGDVVKLIRTIKDSVAQGGGLTAEVKAMVRDLRGEVLGMGRETVGAGDSWKRKCGTSIGDHVGTTEHGYSRGAYRYSIGRCHERILGAGTHTADIRCNLKSNLKPHKHCDEPAEGHGTTESTKQRQRHGSC